MNTIVKKISLVVMIGLIVTSCATDDGNNNAQTNAPTAAEFTAIKQTALDGLTQNFQFNAQDGLASFTSDKGVQININANCLTLNGNPVATGQIDLEYIELFDGGSMLVTDKTTMGRLPNGDMALIISGGEFYINATKNGQQLDITCPIQLIIPSSLTGGADNGMVLWDGTIDAQGNLDWDQQVNQPIGGQGGVFNEGQGTNAYYIAFINDFGWTNVDKFYSDPRPKTTILASAPSGYNFQNSAIYLHYDGQGSALAKLDTYNPTTQQFSEHYGQIPIGLACHVIFVTEESGNYKYAIKAVTVAAGDVYTFTETETTVGTQSQLINAINALP